MDVGRLSSGGDVKAPAQDTGPPSVTTNSRCTRRRAKRESMHREYRDRAGGHDSVRSPPSFRGTRSDAVCNFPSAPGFPTLRLMPIPAIPDDDAALMLLVREGDTVAFTQLVDRWKQPVIHFVYRLLPDADEAEDIAQGVFVQLWKSASRYERQARFSTFLFTIARNLCLNEIRRRSRHPAESLEARLEPEGDAPARQVSDPAQISPDDQAQRGELVHLVDEALAALPEKQRIALALCREGELSYDEIAVILGTTVPATKSLIHRAREVLKSRLKPYLASGAWGSMA